MKKTIMASSLATLLFAPAVHAEDGSSVRVSGFGTAALTATDTDKAEFGRPNQASGATTHPRTGVDSNLGLQVDAPLNSWLSVTAQGLVRKDAEDDYGAEATWAFVKAKLSDDVSVRVGRMGLPVFMISDYRNVGYANTMLRPPAEVYSQVSFGGVDGADITWQHSFGDTTYTAQFAAGRTRAAINGGPTLEVNRIKALNLLVEHGPLTLRFGRADSRLTLTGSPSMDGLLASLRAAGAGYRIAQLAPLADAIAIRNKKGTFTSVGASLDWKNTVVQSEYAKRRGDSYLNDTTSWYLMAGYRFGKLLPYVSHASLAIDRKVDNTIPAACPAGYPAACTPTLRALSAAVGTLPYTGVSQGEQVTDTIGLRWDFYRSLAFKFQLDHVRPTAMAGQLIKPQAGFHGPVNVGAVALDFVF